MKNTRRFFRSGVLNIALFSFSLTGLGACASRVSPTTIPRHLLHSPCAHARSLPGDPETDPILFAGCDDEARTVFIRANIAATVLIRVSRFESETGQLKYSGGTGTVIDAGGTVVTAFHVIKDHEFVVVTLQELTANGQGIRRLRDIPMSVVAVSPENDVALLRPSHAVPMPDPMTLCRRQRPAEHEVLWHFGRTTTWAAGEVTSTNALANDVRVMEVDVRINFGDSGGPLVNAAGQLVGITLSMSDKNTMYFVPIDQALTALGFSGGTDACSE